MPRTRIPSPARSEGVISTPRKHRFRGSRSIGSPARSNSSVKLSSIVQEHKMNSFVLSPLGSRRSVLSDNTDIEAPGRKSWWKRLEENSEDVMEVIENKQIDQDENVEEYIDADILSQEKKNYTVDLPESSDAESISSIVIPQRKLFTQKDSQSLKVFGKIMDNRESLAQLHRSKINYDKSINVGKKDLFNRGTKERSKPVFPAALLNVSINRTLPNKTKEFANQGQSHNLFGNRAGAKRKNIFAEFIVSESEDEIPDIQPKVFGFSKNNEHKQQKKSTSHEPRETSPTSDITDIEIDEWKLLPSSTMVDNQFGNIEGSTPVKIVRLNKPSEATELAKECSNNAIDKTKQSTWFQISKFRNGEEFIESPCPEQHNNNSKQKHIEKNNSNIKMTNNNEPKNQDNIRDAASSSKSCTEQTDTDKIEYNLRMNKNMSNVTEIRIAAEDSKKDKVSEEIQNDDDDDIILQYENDDFNLDEAHQENVNNKSLTYQQQSNTSNINNHNEKNTTLDKNKSHLKASDSSQKLSSSFQLKYVNDKLKEQISSSKNVSKNITLTKNVTNYSVTREINDDLQNKQSAVNCNIRDENLIITSSLTGEDIKKGPATHELHNNEKQFTTLKEVLVDKDEIYLDKNVVIQKHNKSNDNNSSENYSFDKRKNTEKEKINNTNKLDVDLSQENVYDKVEVHRISQQEKKDNVNDNNYEYAKNVADYQKENHVIDDEVDEEKNEEDERIQEETDEEIMEENDEEVQQENDEMIQDENDEDNEEENYEEIQEKNDEEVQEEIEEIIQEENGEEIHEDTYEDNEIENNEEVQDTEDEDEENLSEDNQKEEDEEIQTENNKSREESENEDDDIHEENDDKNREDNEAEDLRQEVSEKSIHADAEDQNEIKNKNYDNKEQNEDQELIQQNNFQNQSETVNRETLKNDKSIHGVTKQSKLDLETKNELIRGENNLVIEADNHIADSNNTKENNKTRRVTLYTTHDTSAQHRHRIELGVKSPEYIRHYVPNEMESFSPKRHDKSIRKTKSIIKIQQGKPSLAPLRENTAISDEGSKNSSVERSCWDSHRTTRKTLRQTFGKDFTPRKSLRALVMEKSAKRQTYGHDMTVKVPLACSTKLPENMDVDISEDDDDDNGDNGEIKGIHEEINEPEQTNDAEETENTKENNQENISSYNSPSTDVSEQGYSTNADIPQQLSDMPNDTTEESDHEMSRMRRQATLEKYLQKMKIENLEKRRQAEEAVRNSLKATTKESFNFFKMPARPNAALRRINMKTGQTNSKVKQIKSTLIPIENLPAEILDDMKYKPPRRYQPSNASWITKRLYKFLEAKLEPKYDYKARVRAEKLVETIYNFTKDTRRHNVASASAVDVLKQEMARLNIVRTHFEFYEFFHDFMPREIRVKVVPDVVNKISLPKHGIFSDIIR